MGVHELNNVVVRHFMHHNPAGFIAKVGRICASIICNQVLEQKLLSSIGFARQKYRDRVVMSFSRFFRLRDRNLHFLHWTGGFLS